MAERLKGKVAVVFGAGGPPGEWSNGKAACVAYAREGAIVVAIDRLEDAADEAAGAVRKESGQALALTADVTSTYEVNDAVAKAIQVYGRIDILHNNVGVVQPGGPIETDDAAFLRSMDINVGSMHRTVRATLPHFLAQGGGAIVNISSLSAIRWSGYSYFAYYTSKAALNQATVAIALQYADKGIRANAIMPGVIDTPLVYKQISSQYKSVDEMRAARQKAVPMKRTGTPWDIANAAVFLASDEAAFITGICLPVDGGHSQALSGLV